MNTAQLIERCYLAAKSKGFWDTERNQAEAFALILSELYEAFEAHRKGRFANLQGYENYILALQEDLKQNSETLIKFSELEFQLKIKDSFEDELADVLIRIFDFCGGFKMQIMPFDTYFISERLKSLENFGEKILLISYYSTFEYYGSGIDIAINQMFYAVLHLCKELNIDIEKHIELKLAYNATRAIRHGANY